MVVDIAPVLSGHSDPPSRWFNSPRAPILDKNADSKGVGADFIDSAKHGAGSAGVDADFINSAGRITDSAYHNIVNPTTSVHHDLSFSSVTFCSDLAAVTVDTALASSGCSVPPLDLIDESQRHATSLLVVKILSDISVTSIAEILCVQDLAAAVASLEIP